MIFPFFWCSVSVLSCMWFRAYRKFQTNNYVSLILDSQVFPIYHVRVAAICELKGRGRGP